MLTNENSNSFLPIRIHVIMLFNGYPGLSFRQNEHDQKNLTVLTYFGIAKTGSSSYSREWVEKLLKVKVENMTELALHLLDKMYVDNR